ncbi:MAG TPA: hypothetical protein VMX12_02520 [Acidimicrobiia bacterium]|nr:hypothetical protein [Acidimicrobiia bacterium]
MKSTTFKSLAVGAEFKMDRGVESGLLTDMDKSGRTTYRKISARRYSRADTFNSALSVGSINVTVWEIDEEEGDV